MPKLHGARVLRTRMSTLAAARRMPQRAIALQDSTEIFLKSLFSRKSSPAAYIAAGICNAGTLAAAMYTEHKADLRMSDAAGRTTEGFAKVTAEIAKVNAEIAKVNSKVKDLAARVEAELD